MSSIWQLSWNHKNYNGDGRMEAAAANASHRHMLQSWGRSSPSNIDKIAVGDTVYISCNKKCIGKAVVTRAFFSTTEIHTDEFVLNPQDHVKRNTPQLYCGLLITDQYFGDHRQDLRGNQNTFCNPTNAFWKQ
jgi:hypothetical protein